MLRTRQEIVRPLALEAGEHRPAAVLIQRGERPAGRRPAPRSAPAPPQSPRISIRRSASFACAPTSEAGGKLAIARHQHVDQCGELRRQRLRLAIRRLLLTQPSTSLILTGRPSLSDLTVAWIIAVAIRPSWPLASGVLVLGDAVGEVADRFVEVRERLAVAGDRVAARTGGGSGRSRSRRRACRRARCSPGCRRACTCCRPPSDSRSG